MNPLTAPRRRRKEARPAEIATAALEVFAEKGFSAAKLDEVAQRAGVSKGTLYLYFSSKEELFKAMVREAVLPNLQEMEGWVASFQGSSADLLRQFLSRTATRITQQRLGRIPKMIIAEAGNFPDLAQFWVDEFVSRMQHLLNSVLERGFAAGEFREAGAQTAMLVLSPILVMALWNAAIGPAVGRSLDPEQWARDAAELLLQGLASKEAA